MSVSRCIVCAIPLTVAMLAVVGIVLFLNFQLQTNYGIPSVFYQVQLMGVVDLK